MSALVRMTMLLMVMKISEGTVKPVVSFTPNWRKIFVYESMTLACNVDPSVQGIRRFYWYKDNVRLNQHNQSFTIHFALQEDGGSYQCKADKGAKSDPAKLKVLGGWLILQVPQLIYEGESFTLKCHSYPGYEVKTTVFLLHEKPLNSSGDELPVGKVNLTTADQYKCKKEIFHHNGYRVQTDMELVVVTELFSSPEITVTPYPARAGGNITVTCHVNRSPLRPDTKLEIAFYRNDRKVRGFGSSDKYQISAARPHDSGDYSCEAKATANNVRKMSRKINIQIQAASMEMSGQRSALLCLLLVAVLLPVILSVALIFRYRNTLFTQRGRCPQEQLPGATVRFSPNKEVSCTYTDIIHARKGPAALPAQQDGRSVTYAEVTFTETPTVSN